MVNLDRAKQIVDSSILIAKCYLIYLQNINPWIFKIQNSQFKIINLWSFNIQHPTSNIVFCLLPIAYCLLRISHSTTISSTIILAGLPAPGCEAGVFPILQARTFIYLASTGANSALNSRMYPPY